MQPSAIIIFLAHSSASICDCLRLQKAVRVFKTDVQQTPGSYSLVPLPACLDAFDCTFAWGHMWIEHIDSNPTSYTAESCGIQIAQRGLYL